MPLTLCVGMNDGHREREVELASSGSTGRPSSTILLALDLDHGRVGLAVAVDEELDRRSGRAS